MIPVARGAGGSTSRVLVVRIGSALAGVPTWVAHCVAMGAPSGTVTFLFTDIEGSTRLWRKDGVSMR
jgi:class 3 adenylate cyclase